MSTTRKSAFDGREMWIDRQSNGQLANKIGRDHSGLLVDVKSVVCTLSLKGSGHSFCCINVDG